MGNERMKKNDLWEKVRRDVKEHEEARRLEPKLKDLSWALRREEEVAMAIERLTKKKGWKLRRMLKANGCACQRAVACVKYSYFKFCYQGMESYLVYYRDDDNVMFIMESKCFAETENTKEMKILQRVMERINSETDVKMYKKTLLLQEEDGTLVSLTQLNCNVMLSYLELVESEIDGVRLWLDNMVRICWKAVFWLDILKSMEEDGDDDD